MHFCTHSFLHVFSSRIQISHLELHGWQCTTQVTGWYTKSGISNLYLSGLQTMFSLSGTIKSNGQNFLSNMCTKHTSQAHSVKSLWAGFRPRAFWRSLQSAPIFEPFLCKYYFLVFTFEHFLRGQFFFWDRRSHGPVDFVGLLYISVLWTQWFVWHHNKYDAAHQKGALCRWSLFRVFYLM